MKHLVTIIALVLLVAVILTACTPGQTIGSNAAVVTEDKEPEEKKVIDVNNLHDIYLAGGCFWGMQDLIRKRPGVLRTRVGYTGGDNNNPTYRNHPGHAEAIEIEFDPALVSYRDLLEFFFQIHDPTTRNRQGNDVGSSYRSEIFYTSDDQRLVSLDTIEDVNASGLWPGRVVTDVTPAATFWEAEPEHQDRRQGEDRDRLAHHQHRQDPGARRPDGGDEEGAGDTQQGAEDQGRTGLPVERQVIPERRPVHDSSSRAGGCHTPR